MTSTGDLAPRLTAALADRYRIERELGAGGMATVYLAHDARHDRSVAVKVLRPELAAVIGAERFLSEIRTTANLQHPHILPLFDSGEADGFLFYVMPFIEGESLRDRLDREKQLPIADAVRIATEIAAALDYAHRRDVIHRDIKPANILLHDGSALVADFGIALAASRAGGTRMTETGMSLGTPHYMSPEQAMGEREITARSDVYALGAVTYEMLLGEPPFTGPTAQSIVAKVMSERPTPLTARRDRIPGPVEDAVLTALEKLPADRFGSAVEFAAALSLPAGPNARRHSASGAGRHVDWRLAALGGAVAGAALVGVWSFARPQRADAPDAAPRNQLTFNGRSHSPAISPSGDYLAYLDVRCPRGPDNACSHSLFVQDRGSDRPVAVLRDLPEMGPPRFSPDGASLIVSARLDSARAGLFVVPRLGGVPRRIANAGVFDTHARGDSAIHVAAEADGRRRVLQIIALSDGRVTDSVVLPPDPVDGIGWSPDGELFAVVEDYARLSIVRRDGTVADSVRGPFRATVRWTPDGRGIVLFRALPVKEDDLVYFPIDRDGRIGPGEVRISAIQTLLTGEFDLARQSGQLVLSTGSASFDIWTFELGGSTEPARQRTSGTTWYSVPSIAPDGSRVYYQRGDALGDNLYELTLPDVEDPLTAERHPAVSGTNVSRDGRRVVYGFSVSTGARFGIMELATRQSEFFLATELNSRQPPVPRGRGAVYLLSRGRALAMMETPTAAVSRLLAPDSATILAFGLDRSEDSAAVLVGDPKGLKLGVTPLSEWRPRWVHTFATGEQTASVTWSDDGFLYFWLWPTGDETPAVWRVRSSGGPPSYQRPLPPACRNAVVAVAVSAPRGVCAARDLRGDIWLVHVPGVTR